MAKLGTNGRSAGPRKANENMRLIFSTVIGIVLGYLIGICFPTVSMTKLHIPSSIISYIEDTDSSITAQNLLNEAWNSSDNQNTLNTAEALKIYVPTNPRGAESLPPKIVVPESDIYLRRLWGNPDEDLVMKQK